MPNTPTVAVFVRGGLVQDVCADAPVRVIVLDFDTDQDTLAGDGKDESNAGATVAHTHPDGSEDRAYLAEYVTAASPANAAEELRHVLCAIATAADAEHGSDEPTEITDRAPDGHGGFMYRVERA